MADDILEQLERYEGPKHLPPIADLGFALYEAGGRALDAAALDRLRDALEKDDLGTLTHQLTGLGALALYLRDHLGDPAAATQVARLIAENGPKYASIGERILAALQDRGRAALALLERFSGRPEAERPVAPRYGTPPPVGTVPLKDLRPRTEGPVRPSLPPRRPPGDR